MFITPNAKVPVELDGNTIYIRAKMDVGTKAKVENEFSAINPKGERDEVETELTNIGSYSMALLVYNIVGWEGPAFVDEKGVPVPCNRTTIQQLDPDDPLVLKVKEEIAQRNAPKAAPNPN